MSCSQHVIMSSCHHVIIVVIIVIVIIVIMVIISVIVIMCLRFVFQVSPPYIQSPCIVGTQPAGMGHITLVSCRRAALAID